MRKFLRKISTYYILPLLAIFHKIFREKETVYNENGVSFTCPEGWFLSQKKVYNDQTYHVKIDHSGIGQGGTMMITWHINPIDLEDWLAKRESQTHELPYFVVEFGPLETFWFKGFEGIGKSYSGKRGKYPFAASIQCFNAHDLSFCVTKMAWLDTKEADNKAFDWIEDNMVICEKV